MSVSVNHPVLLITRGQPVYKWLLALIVLVVLGLGWRFPVLGFVVLLAMALGMGGGFFRGRWVCGNLCPRGSLLDTWLGNLPRRSVPAWMGKPAFRWSVLVVLISFMVMQLSVDPGNWQHWGIVFWRMCLITSGAALLLALSFASRAWCGICPVGTVAAGVGSEKYPLRIAAACRGCRLCEQSCPMQLTIAVHRSEGQLPHRDCLKCSACVKSCPIQALKWPD